MSDQGLRLSLLNLRLKKSFNLSKASAIEKTTLLARFRDGIGEGSPSIHYGLPAEKIVHALSKDLGKFEGASNHQTLNDFTDSLPSSLNVGRCAIEMALLDYLAKQEQLPLYEYLGLQKPAHVTSSFTVTPGSEKEIETQMETARFFDVLKLKVGFDEDLRFIDSVLRQGSFRLRLDANGGWDVNRTIERIRSLSGYPIEFYEQPMTEPSLTDLDRVKTKTECCLILDESIISPDDIIKFRPVIDGINLKLSKCGGIQTTMKMALEAKESGLKLLLGCMIETAVGITAALHLASLFDFFDLDSLLVTENDPFWGAQIDGQNLLLPDGLGIGIQQEDNTLA